MKPADFGADASGKVVMTVGGYYAFIPGPALRTIKWDDELVNQLSAADQGIALLSGVGRTMPNPHLISGALLRREAVLSSRIEGTQASLSDLFLLEAAPSVTPRVPDTHEVLNYVKALKYGLARLRELPISTRLVREIHERLLEDVRGTERTPGQFRRSQNWIGSPGCDLVDAQFVPPPPEEVEPALSHLERYIHEPPNLPLLIRLAVIHCQFEVIHPFLDGNGRIGRLLLPLLLCAEGTLPAPLLYLSAFFESNRSRYYQSLLEVSTRGDWRQWMLFFLQGVAEQSADAVQRCKRLLTLQQKYRDLIQTARKPALIVGLIERLFDTPFITISQVRRLLEVTYPTAKKYVDILEGHGILIAAPPLKREKLFVAQEVLAAIEE